MAYSCCVTKGGNIQKLPIFPPKKLYNIDWPLVGHRMEYSLKSKIGPN